MGTLSKVLSVVFSPLVFAVVLLVCGALTVVNIAFNVALVEYPWGMMLFPLIVLFGLIGYFLDERQYL